MGLAARVSVRDAFGRSRPGGMHPTRRKPRLASKNDSTDSEAIPFGAMERPRTRTRGATTEAPAERASESRQPRRSGEGEGGEGGPDDGERDWRRPEKRRGGARRGGRRRRGRGQGGPEEGAGSAEGQADGQADKRGDQGVARREHGEGGPGDRAPSDRAPSDRAPSDRDFGDRASGDGGPGDAERRRRGRGRRRGGKNAQRGGGQPQVAGPRGAKHGAGQQHGAGQHGSGAHGQHGSGQHGSGPLARNGAVIGEVEGMLVLEHQNHGELRLLANGFLPDKKRDVHVPPRLIQRLGLREGSLIKGTYGRGHGKSKFDLLDVQTVDGRDPAEVRNVPSFKSLTSIDPDFHYAFGDFSDDVSLRIVDLVCPIGRGQRGLVVAPPRSGKTVLLQKIARAIEQNYEDVHLIVLLVDERPEEATEWKRTIERGQVFVSTNDEMPRKHVDLADAVWRRCRRLVEMGEDVFLVIDSITRLARAHNNLTGAGGRTMSGGVDTRAMEKPKQFFGAARNTETAGSLTILGTTLVETGSRMDQVIFEEFKGTGNMELVLSRKLADRRIFPAIDIQRSGTRKEEKLYSSRRLKLISTLRRVLLRMSFIEAMELLITKLDDYANVDDFLTRFEIDPEE